MRDHVVFYLNGQRVALRGDDATATLSEVVREHQRLTGTKVVCAEGDCGACTVLVGRPRAAAGLAYRPLDACITFAFQADGCHVVTVEGLRTGSALHPVQQAMVDAYASQCGFCTPGMVVALAGLFEAQRGCGGGAPSEHQVRRALAGNLCRCTGYWQIFEAAARAGESAVPALADLYPEGELGAELAVRAVEPVLVEGAHARVFVPDSQDAALAWRAEHRNATVVAGATDLAVARNKGKQPLTEVLALGERLPGFAAIAPAPAGRGDLVGAGTTIEAWREHARGLAELDRVLLVFGAPQIRHAATLGGNLVNASPIADTVPFLLVAGAVLHLRSRRGARSLPIGDFYRGYKRIDLAPDELLHQVEVPPLPDAATLHLWKHSRRRDLDISSFTAAALLEWQGDVVVAARLAMGGVAETVRRLPRTEALLAGKRFDLETARAAGRLARSEIAPIGDVRGSIDYRLQLADNTLQAIYHQRAAAREGRALPSTAVA